MSAWCSANNSLEGMACAPPLDFTVRVTAVKDRNRFPSELRRWRKGRRLSQLDLALLAGTTQRHLSFIEQGRSTPGRTMVVRLAESLELSLHDRNQLLVAAGYAPVFTESRIDGDTLRPVMHALGTILDGHLPFPAVVVRPGGEVIASNAAIDVLFEGAAAELIASPVNAYRLALHPNGMAPRIGNFGEWANHVLAGLRRASQRSPGGVYDLLLAELQEYVPPYTPGSDHLGFAVPLRLACAEGELTLITTLTSFATATDVTLAGLQLEAFLPADDQSAQILQARHARQQPRRRQSATLPA